jgi:hypothetical protein
MGAGIDEYDNQAESAFALLQVQAHSVSKQHGDLLARKR